MSETGFEGGSVGGNVTPPWSWFCELAAAEFGDAAVEILGVDRDLFARWRAGVEEPGDAHEDPIFALGSLLGALRAGSDTDTYDEAGVMLDEARRGRINIAEWRELIRGLAVTEDA